MKIPFLVGWTSINPSYFDVNRRGTRFWHTAICQHDPATCPNQQIVLSLQYSSHLATSSAVSKTMQRLTPFKQVPAATGSTTVKWSGSMLVRAHCAARFWGECENGSRWRGDTMDTGWSCFGNDRWLIRQWHQVQGWSRVACFQLSLISVMDF